MVGLIVEVVKDVSLIAVYAMKKIAQQAGVLIFYLHFT